MHDYVVLDVFTDTPLQGNPVAVFLDGADLDGETMQRVGRELNLSETVFLSPGDAECDAAVRIFTPSAELPFAGHPVLGTAFVVGGRTGGDRVVLRTGAGLIPIALRRRDGAIVSGEMDQPIPVSEPIDEAAVLAALRVDRPHSAIRAYRNGPLHAYVELPDAAAVDALTPDLGALAAIHPGGVSCYAVTGEARVHVRVFVPALGVPEDPATGSAAGPLAVHLAAAGTVAWGREVEIHQGVAMGRPSLLHARALGDAQDIQRVLVSGSAVSVAQGRYRLR